MCRLVKFIRIVSHFPLANEYTDSRPCYDHEDYEDLDDHLLIKVIHSADKSCENSLVETTYLVIKVNF